MIEVIVTASVRLIDDKTQKYEETCPLRRQTKYLLTAEELHLSKLGEALTAKLKLAHVFEDLLTEIAEDVAGLA
jgi:hypothetical protein